MQKGARNQSGSAPFFMCLPAAFHSVEQGVHNCGGDVAAPLAPSRNNAGDAAFEQQLLGLDDIYEPHRHADHRRGL